jgi:hypothetical protein
MKIGKNLTSFYCRNMLFLVFFLCFAHSIFAQPPIKVQPEVRIQGETLARPDLVIDQNTCDESKMMEIRAPATEDKSHVYIDCNLTLSKSDIITKRLIFEGPKATGVTCRCNGARLNGGKNTVNDGRDMIEVRSKKSGSRWKPARNIAIRDCDITGSVRVWGMGKNGETTAIKESSKRDANNSNHVGRLRANAPSHITFDDITITGVGRNPFYLAPGVTHVTLINSELKGQSSKVGIYLDAESAFNTIANNNIHVKTDDDDWGDLPFVTNRGWPQVAIDGSSHNMIKNNRFAAINNGGIYFYRNCGEGGTIRHTPPEHNVVVNNRFYYRKYKGSKPAIYLGSRDYGQKERTLGHCDKDDGRPYGSSKSEKDYARHNIIIQNQLYKRKIWKMINGQNRRVNASISDMIVTKNKSVNSPNFIKYNELVGADIKRSAGCYVSDGYKDFLLNGQSLDVYKRPNGKLVCTGIRKTCVDGELKVSAVTNRTITQVPFECQVEGSNSGCRKLVRCPGQKKIVGATLACNLEFGNVTDNSISNLPVNTLSVIVRSDNTSDGSCYIEKNKISKGSTSLDDIQDLVRAVVGCREKDKNGGDCHVKGVLFCR